MRGLRTLGLGLMLVCLGCSASDKSEAVADIVGEPLTPEELRSSVSAEFTIRQDYIAACMGAQGFEYVAWVDLRMLPQASDSEVASLSPLEFAEQYGFGVSTRLEPEFEPDPDPNIEIYDALSSDVQAAYNVALTGTSSLGHLDTIEISEVTRGANSCEQYAYDKFVPADGPSEEVMQQYRELMAEIEDRTFSDPRVLAAGNAGVLCVREAGFDVETDMPIIDQFLVQGESLAGVTDISLEAMQEQLTDEQVAEVQDFERLFATAVHECFAEMRSAEEVVRTEIEKEVVEDNYSVFAEAARGLRQNNDG